MRESGENGLKGLLSDASGEWYALTVRSKLEKTVARALSYKGLTPFLPVYRERHQWSDRMKAVELPLFPGYVFCRFSIQDRLRVLSTPGVRSIVASGGRPAPVPEDEIGSVRTMVDSGLPVTPWSYLSQGQPVVIQDGPLRGLAGRIARANGAWKVVLNVNLLQRSVAVTVDCASIEAPDALYPYSPPWPPKPAPAAARDRNECT